MIHSMASQSLTQEQCPYGTIIEHMVNDLKEKLPQTEISEEELKEILRSLSIVLQYISSLDELQCVSPSKTNDFESFLLPLVKDICFPVIYLLHLLPEADKVNSEKGKALTLVVRLILECCQYFGEKTLLVVLMQLTIPMCTIGNAYCNELTAFKDDGYHRFLTEPLTPFFSLELFCVVLNNRTIFIRYLESLKHTKDKVLTQLFSVIEVEGTYRGSVGDTAVFCKAFTILCKLFSYFPKDLLPLCESEIWERYTKLLNSSGQDVVWKHLYVFYSLRTYFFPLEMAEREQLSSRIRSNNFWSIVQAGLVSTDPSQRKLSMYLLKRLVDTCSQNDCSVNSNQMDQPSHLHNSLEAPLFWWLPKAKRMLLAIWDDFILLIETLEEKQVHIIKPLLSRMQKLITATSVAENGHSVLHSSWLVTLITRCFQHDSPYMSRWGALTLLTLNFKTVPLIQHGQLKFLSHDLLVYLQENKLYSRYESTELGKSSPVGEALREFFANLFCTLTKEQKVEYLENLLRIVCENRWGSIPLVFVFEGLSHIASTPVMGPKLLELARQILQSCLATHEAFTRGAIQCFICQMVMNLVDLESVSLREFFATLAPLNRDESLRRGTTLWKQVITWLSSEKVSRKWYDEEIFELASEYIRGTLEDNSSTIVDGYKVTSVARMLVLYADVKLTTTLQRGQPDDMAVAYILSESPLALILDGIPLTDISGRAYVNVSGVDRCLSLLYSLTKELGTFQNNQVDLVMARCFARDSKDVLHFIKNRLSHDLTKVSDIDEIQFYTDVLLSLGQKNGLCQAELLDLIAFVKKALSLFGRAKNTGLDAETLRQYDVLSTSAVMVLAAVLKILSTHCEGEDMAMNNEIRKAVGDEIRLNDVPIPNSRRCVRSDGGEEQPYVSKLQTGVMVSKFISSKWQSQKFLFKMWMNSTDDSGDMKPPMDVCETLSAALDDMAIGSGSSDAAIFEALEVLMQDVVKEPEPADISTLLKVSWAKVMEEKKNCLFWQKLQAMIPMALHKAVLAQDKDSVIGIARDELIEKLVTLGNDKTGIMYLVFDHLCGKILQEDPERIIATQLIPLLVDGCCMGTVHKRGERLWLDVCAYIESLGDGVAVNQVISSASKNDLYFRIILLNWLSRLRPDVPADHKFVTLFLDNLMTKYLALATQTTYKQFSNSFSHRQKHRMVLVLLMLVDFVRQESVEEYLTTLWHALEIECHPSVRQNLEWMVMILIGRFPDHVSGIWDVFKMYDKKRSVCLCSLFLIMSHVGIKLPREIQEKYYSQALSAVLPWTMAHHYNTRIFAQGTLTRLWEQCKSLQLATVISQHSVVQSCMDFLFNNGNASGTVSKLLSIYMYSAFDPVRDFSMETIFHTLPRLACLADDEWILPRQFVQMDQLWSDEKKHLIPLRNSSDQLSQCTAGPWRMKAQFENEDDVAESADGDVQKKVMPWRQMSPDQETEAELASQRQRSSEGGLVVVTSLIDKVPNLGGLCRTSEIFGVSEFVIGNLTHLEDRMFQSLSVSAQKWIRITEVLRPRLTEFLEEKRMQGYTLVGVEQTANSVCLQNYQFPKKTLLLLGNEKEGIPVDIIQSLDVCVEIPQLGVIRSLNVHVCGALIVWEYTRQHMRNANAAGAGTTVANVASK